MYFAVDYQEGCTHRFTSKKALLEFLNSGEFDYGPDEEIYVLEGREITITKNVKYSIE